MTEAKKIPTFSWLIRKAEAMLRKDPDEYKELRKYGSTKLLRGVRVKMELMDSCSDNAFTLISSGENGVDYARITAARHNGEFYTRYQLLFTTTKYRKRMHKFLPISLPEGAKCRKHTKCIYYNADGTKSHEGHWYGGSRGRSGTPSEGQLHVKDSDGTLIKWSELPPGDENTLAHDLNYANPTDLWHDFLPGSCNSKLDWYASMVPPEVEHYRTVWSDGSPLKTKLSGLLWDANKMRLLAAKVHSAAIRLAKKYPHLKVALYPMASSRPDGEHLYDHPIHLNRFERDGESFRQELVLGRDEDDEPMIWHLPELVVYWTIPAEKAGVRFHKGLHYPKWIRVQIPPVGCQSLLRDSMDSSAFSKFYRWGAKRYPSSYFSVSRWQLPVEAAYHRLIALAEGSRGNSIRGVLQTGRYHFRQHGTVDADTKIHDWNQGQNVVVVWDNSADNDDDWVRMEPIACRPDNVFAGMEERELIDSLPLC
jgi:hypothetical protein